MHESQLMRQYPAQPLSFPSCKFGQLFCLVIWVGLVISPGRLMATSSLRLQVTILHTTRPRDCGSRMEPHSPYFQPTQLKSMRSPGHRMVVSWQGARETE